MSEPADVGALAAAFNEAVVAHFNGNAIDAIDVLAAAATVAGSYISDFPPEKQIDLVNKFDRLMRQKVIEAAEAKSTSEVMREARRTYEVDFLMSERPPADREFLVELIRTFLVAFNGAINEYRLKGFKPHHLRADGTILLSNMLRDLVNNTTANVAERPKVLRRLHRLILENLR
jgi:hypothetical protein